MTMSHAPESFQSQKQVEDEAEDTANQAYDIVNDKPVNPILINIQDPYNGANAQLSYDQDDIDSMVSTLEVVENDIKVLKRQKEIIKTVIDELVVTGNTKGVFNGAVDTFIHRMTAGAKTNITFKLI